MNTLVLKGVSVFDGVSDLLIPNQDVVVEGGRILEVTPTGRDYENARVLELAGCTVTPGFIDCHMHMLLEEVSPDKNRSMTTTTPGGEAYPNADSAAAYMSVGNCRNMLQAGFTTVVDGGGRNFADCALREAIQKGHVIGPNYFVAGKQITANRAHFTGFSVEPYGPYGMRKAVRDLVWWGVDHIKIQLNPPIRMVGRSAEICDFTEEEVAAAIDEAHNYGIPVHAHLRGAEAIKRFLRAGGDYVVHGTGMDNEGIELILKYNKTMLPTLLSPSPEPSKELLAAKTDAVVDLLAKTAQRHWDSARRAHQAGVKMAFSTDMGTLGNHIGKNAREFSNLCRIGMTPAQALRSATSVAAEVVGLQDELGKVKAGYRADLTVLRGDPLADITQTEQVLMTLKVGQIVHDIRDCD